MSALRPLIDRYRAGQISRREFLTAGTAFGVTLPAATSILSSQSQAAPKKGGHVRGAATGGSTTDTLDPALLVDPYLYTLNYTLRNNLTEILPDGSLVGELAESWEASPDAKVWTFKLREGVEFHNGKTIDSEDVVATFNYHRGDDSKSIVKTTVDQIDEIATDGKNVVRMSLKAGNADWAYLVSDFHLSIVPLVGGELDTLSGVGTGPYVLERFDPGVIATFKRNPKYWKEGRAHFDSGELLNIADGTARLNGLVSGSLDVIGSVELKTVHLLQGAPGVKVLETTGTWHLDFPMLTDTAPFDDVNVRLALKHAIDREEILNKILKGHGVLGNDHPIAPANRYFAGDLPQRELDLDKAKYYLGKAGLSELKIRLSASDGIWPGSVDASVLFQQSAAKAGINIEVERVPADGFWSNIYIVKPFLVTPWGGRPTEDWMFTVAYAADAAWNDTRWKNDRFNELLVAARSELDESKRREMYREMQLIVRDDGGAVIPVFLNNLFAVSDKISMEQTLANNWELDGARFMERWWFA